MAINNIYFAPSFHGIKYFLSLYEPGSSSLVIVSEIHKSVIAFIRDIMPDAKMLVLPYKLNTLSKFKFKSRRLHFRELYEIFLYRRKYSKILDRKFDINPKANAYFFSNFGLISFLILVGHLYRKRITIKFIDISSSDYYCRKALKKDLSLGEKINLLALSIVSGIKITRFNARRKIWLGWEDCINPSPYRPMSWENISKKYYLESDKIEDNAVLFIDSPILDYTDLNIKKSQHNLLRYFKPLLDEGKRIYVKPHYGSPEIHPFLGTVLENKINVLNADMPVELILHNYNEVYFSYSTGLRKNFKGRKYSIFNLLVFDSNETRDEYKQVGEDTLGDYIKDVEFVELQDII